MDDPKFLKGSVVLLASTHRLPKTLPLAAVNIDQESLYESMVIGLTKDLGGLLHSIATDKRHRRRWLELTRLTTNDTTPFDTHLRAYLDAYLALPWQSSLQGFRPFGVWQHGTETITIKLWRRRITDDRFQDSWVVDLEYRPAKRGEAQGPGLTQSSSTIAFIRQPFTATVMYLTVVTDTIPTIAA